MAELPLPVDVAYAKVIEAVRSIGKVEESNDLTRTLNVRMRYGLNKVRLRIAILSGSAPNTAVLDIAGRGQDVLGVASRKCIDRLLSAIG